MSVDVPQHVQHTSPLAAGEPCCSHPTHVGQIQVLANRHLCRNHAPIVLPLAATSHMTRRTAGCGRITATLPRLEANGGRRALLLPSMLHTSAHVVRRVSPLVHCPSGAALGPSTRPGCAIQHQPGPTQVLLQNWPRMQTATPVTPHALQPPQTYCRMLLCSPPHPASVRRFTQHQTTSDLLRPLSRFSPPSIVNQQPLPLIGPFFTYRPITSRRFHPN